MRTFNVFIGDDKYDGNYRAQERCISVGRLLDVLGVESQRLRLDHFATGETQRLENMVHSFVNEIASLGPL